MHKTKKQLHINNITNSIKKTKNTLNTNNTKENLTIYKLKQIYKDIISNENIEHKGILLKFIFNYFLILKNYRNLFQIEYHKNKKSFKILDDFFLSKYKINYYTKSTHFVNRLIIYNSNKINLTNINTSFGKEFANQLGDFYICANNKKLHGIGSSYRITITVHNTVHNTELYAQMCKQSLITDENINKLKKIAQEISIILQLFDKNLITKLNMIKIKNFLGVPYKGNIEKQYIFN
jgi:hypothetical protein